MTYEAYKKKVAKLIRAHRIKMGYSQRVLAEKAEITKKHIEKYEAAENLPRLHTMFQLAEILEISPNELFNEISRKKR